MRFCCQECGNERERASEFVNARKDVVSECSEVDFNDRVKERASEFVNVQKQVVNDYSEIDTDDNVRWSFIPTTGEFRANGKNAIEQENEDAIFRILVMHAPTHDSSLSNSGKWRYGWHFKSRSRKWEVRIQVRVKRPPKGKVYFGIEMSPAAAASSFHVRSAKAVIIKAIQAAIGSGFYQTAGDDPSKAMSRDQEEDLRNQLSVLGLDALQKQAKEAFATNEELQNANRDRDPRHALIELIVMKSKELEPGSFIMPMWVLDQFCVSDPGQEPDLAGDFQGIGTRRTEVGVSQYTQMMEQTVENLDPNKVYTFLFWGVSQFVDASAWTFQWKFLKLDALHLSGPPPIYVVAYDMEGDGDRRHIVSRKMYYFKVALWSDLKPPSPANLKRILGMGGQPVETEQRQPSTTHRRAKMTGLNRVLHCLQGCKVKFGCMPKS